MRNKRDTPQRGAILVWFAVSLVVLLGFVGVAIDAGRMYIVRTETQGFADAAGLAAGAQLDGTDAGIVRARAQAAAGWNKYNFHSTSFPTTSPNFVVEFALVNANNSNIPYQPSWTTTPPSPPKNYQFARVTSTVSLPMTLLSLIPATIAPPIPGLALLTTGISSATISAQSIAGQVNVTTASEGLLPFTVLTHATDSASYGMVPGQNYSIRWTNTNKISEYCAGDTIDTPGGGLPAYSSVNGSYSTLKNGDTYYGHQFLYDAENAGFGSKGTEAGCGSGGCNWTSFLIQDASQIAAAVEAGYMASGISVGTDLKSWLDAGGGGSINTIGGDLNTRVGRDTNQTAYYSACATVAACATNVTNFESNYTGNGQRVAVLPMINPPIYGNSADTITTTVSFGAFLLDINNSYKTTGNASWCAMYLGSAVEWTYRPGAGGPGLYVLRLIK